MDTVSGAIDVFDPDFMQETITSITSINRLNTTTAPVYPSTILINLGCLLSTVAEPFKRHKSKKILTTKKPNRKGSNT